MVVVNPASHFKLKIVMKTVYFTSDFMVGIYSFQLSAQLTSDFQWKEIFEAFTVWKGGRKSLLFLREGRK